VEAADIRGVKSFGMLCSAYDLGWADSSDGLAVDLPDTMVVGEAAPETAPKVSAWLPIPRQGGDSAFGTHALSDSTITDIAEFSGPEGWEESQEAEGGIFGG
jgi:tRNA-binding EMAP/Myf-like protein